MKLDIISVALCLENSTIVLEVVMEDTKTLERTTKRIDMNTLGDSDVSILISKILQENNI